jgi:dolichyl-phosphate-mannose--protein O-mannosyl transferase
MKAVYLYVDAASGAQIWMRATKVIFWGGVVALGGAVGRMVRGWRKWRVSPYPELAFLVSAYLLVWVPWLLSPRIMFLYHYLPAVPVLCILIAEGVDWGVRKLARK